MKRILEFNSPDEDELFEMHYKGPRYYSVLSDIDNTLRTMIKHGHKFDNVDDALSFIREELHKSAEANDCQLY